MDNTLLLILNSAFVVAVVTSSFRIFEKKMDRQLGPIRDNVVNNHKLPEQNLRNQVDRIELTLNNHQDNHVELVRGLKRVEKKVDSLQSWSEAENSRLWKSVKDNEDK